MLLVAWCIGVLAGCALQLQQPALWPLWHYGLLACLGLVLLGALGLAGVRAQRRRAFALGLLAAALLAFASTAWRAQLRLQHTLPEALAKQDLQLTGRIADLPVLREADAQFVFAVEQAQWQGQPVAAPPTLQLGWYASRQLPMPPQGLVPGQRWQLVVRLKPVHGSSNPHGFDYELWMFERGISANGYVRSAQLLAPATPAAPYALARLRHSVRADIVATVADTRIAGVLAALVLGDQSAIERSDWQLFQATGVAHLMSISGLHITLFAWLAMLLIARLWRTCPACVRRLPASHAAWLGGAVVATLYALFTGWGLPAQRTILMLWLATLLGVRGVRWPWWLVLLVAAALVALADPWGLLQAGFWLSFVAVAVLIFTGNSLAHSATNLRNRIAAFVREQARISLVLAPLSLLLFQQFSLVGVALNLLAIPFLTFAVIPLALFGLLWPTAWQWAAAVLQPFMQLLTGAAQLPYAQKAFAAPPLALGVLAVLGAVCLVAPLPWRARLLGAPLVLAAPLYQAQAVGQGQFALWALDVGQGSSVVVRTATHTLVYDTGPRYNSGADAGQRIVMPFLRAQGLQPDMLLISHRDNDHSGGAASVLRYASEAEVLTSMENEDALPARLWQRCVAGQHWQWDGVHFAVLHPQAEDYTGTQKSNAMSCVLRISAGGRSVLLSGDIETAQEAAIVQQQGAQSLRTDVLLASHHGSKNASSRHWLAAVQPRIVLVQSGYLNAYRHPAPAALQRYAQAGAQVWYTPGCGAAYWHSTQPTQIVCQRTAGQRYWHHRLHPQPQADEAAEALADGESLQAMQPAAP